MSEAAWELVFMMVVLKLPIAYLVGVVWWAVRAEVDPYAPAELVAVAEPVRPCPWRRPRAPVRPTRGPRRRAATARR